VEWTSESRDFSCLPLSLFLIPRSLSPSRGISESTPLAVLLSLRRRTSRSRYFPSFPSPSPISRHRHTDAPFSALTYLSPPLGQKGEDEIPPSLISPGVPIARNPFPPSPLWYENSRRLHPNHRSIFPLAGAVLLGTSFLFLRATSRRIRFGVLPPPSLRITEVRAELGPAAIVCIFLGTDTGGISSGLLCGGEGKPTCSFSFSLRLKNRSPPGPSLAQCSLPSSIMSRLRFFPLEPLAFERLPPISLFSPLAGFVKCSDDLGPSHPSAIETLEISSFLLFAS